MATYGSEFVAAPTAMEQIMDLHYSLCVHWESLWMGHLGCLVTMDQLSLAPTSPIPASPSPGMHCCIIASGIICFHFVPTHQNTSDVLTKLSLHKVSAWPFVEVLLFWKGDIMPKVP